MVGDRSPAERTQPGCAGVTRGGKRRGQEYQAGAGPMRAQQVRHRMGGAGDHALGANRRRPAAAAQVDTRFQCRRQPDIAGDDQDQPPLAANTRQIATEGHSRRVMVVAKDDSGLAAGQTRHGCAWVRQPLTVGEQPQARHEGGRAAETPGEEFQVHGVLHQECVGSI